MKYKSTSSTLIKQCIKGERKAQYELYEMHKVHLFGICRRYAKTVIEAEDMLQDGFYKILRDIKQFNNQVPLNAWMRKVMINSALMYIRKYKKVNYTELHEERVEGLLGYDQKMDQTDRAKAIIHIIQTLPEVQQTVFNLKGIDGYSFKEISELLEVNESTLRSHYLRARKNLQSILNKELN